MKFASLYFFAVTLLASACTAALNTDQLYGKWKYVKVGVPDSSPPDTTTRAELEEQKPSIEIKPDGNLTIFWGGKVLSHGTYNLSGKNINYHEALPGGKFRDFPFYVLELTDKQITFETTGEEHSRVTAVKE